MEMNELMKSGIALDKNDLTYEQWFYLTWYRAAVDREFNERIKNQYAK